MRALVISGGGAKGAYAGGIAQNLIEAGKKYDILIGTSTGALLCPLIAVEEMDLLKKAYTTITTDDIFKINPFKIEKNQNGVTRIAIDHWNVLRNIIFHDKRTFGDSSNLDILIKSFITPDIYARIRESNKDVIATVTNLTLSRVEYHSTRENNRETFSKWLHGSASFPPFMNIIEHDGSEYADGGLLEPTPLQEAINRGATEIDVIFLNPATSGSLPIEKIRNGFHYITRFLDIMLGEINNKEISVDTLIIPKDKEIRLTVYPTPRILTNNSLVFDRKIMNSWWDEGYQNTKNSYRKEYILIKGRVPRVEFNGIVQLNPKR